MEFQPKSLNRSADGIQIEWLDGHVSPYPVLLLRRMCPCAVCKGLPDREAGLIPASHFPAEKMEILGAKQIGWYALQFTFSDRHDTGIYSYVILRQQCPCAECNKTYFPNGILVGAVREPPPLCPR